MRFRSSKVLAPMKDWLAFFSLIFKGRLSVLMRYFNEIDNPKKNPKGECFQVNKSFGKGFISSIKEGRILMQPQEIGTWP
jgi:hypothetical protein